MSNSQSLELIDVSGEPTPPPTTKDKELWVVEDSLKDNPGVYQGGAVQTPGGSFIEDEEDDLYGESPEAQTRRIAREALCESLSISKEASTLTAEDSHAASGARKEQPVSSRTAEEQARPYVAEGTTCRPAACCNYKRRVPSKANDIAQLTHTQATLWQNSLRQTRPDLTDSRSKVASSRTKL